MYLRTISGKTGGGAGPGSDGHGRRALTRRELPVQVAQGMQERLAEGGKRRDDVEEHGQRCLDLADVDAALDQLRPRRGDVIRHQVEVWRGPGRAL